MGMKKKLRILTVAAVLLLTMGNLAAESLHYDQHEEMDLNGVDEIVLEIKNLSPKITAGLDFLGIEVHVTSHSEKKLVSDLNMNVFSVAEDSIPQTIIEKEGHLVRVRFTIESGSTFDFIRAGKIRSYIRIPETYEGKIRIVSSSYDIIVHDIEIVDLEIQGKAGNVELNNLTAKNLTVECEMGDTKFNQVNADMGSFKSTLGNIKCGIATFKEVSFENYYSRISVEDLKAEQAFFLNDEGATNIDMIEGKTRIQSNKGNVRAYFAKIIDDITVVNDSGFVRVYLPENSSFNYQYNDGGIGRVEFDFEQKESTNNRTAFQHAGTVGNGGPVVEVSVSSGSLKILPY